MSRASPSCAIMIAGQALAIVGNQADAEDVVQETLCKAYLHREQVTDLRSIEAWLRRVNRTTALNFARDRRRQSGKHERQLREAPPRTK